MPSARTTKAHISSTSRKVEGTLFRVPKHHLTKQSEGFRDMFELPVATDTVPDGSSDEQPRSEQSVFQRVVASNVSLVSPIRLYLIPNGVTDVVSRSLSRLQSAETFTVLRVCVLWQMQDLEGQVLRALSTTSGRYMTTHVTVGSQFRDKLQEMDNQAFL
jgi:hypothetical protein